ncbi:MAG: ArsR family transcriptional regulator [Bacteroidales bacterium]|nr:ArsR family transcriptional regulator [Bacteroidales bacterium]
MLDTLITSKTRLKLLLKFFLNSNSSSYLRSLENEFEESTNSIRLELNRFEKAGLLKSYFKGNKKMFQANAEHPLYTPINSLLIKHLGFDSIIEKVICKLGEVKKVVVVGDFARGMDSSIIDLIFIGDYINKAYLSELIEKVEKRIKRKIRYLIYKEVEFKEYNNNNKIESIVLWKEEDLKVMQISK